MTTQTGRGNIDGIAQSFMIASEDTTFTLNMTTLSGSKANWGSSASPGLVISIPARASTITLNVFPSEIDDTNVNVTVSPDETTISVAIGDQIFSSISAIRIAIARGLDEHPLMTATEPVAGGLTTSVVGMFEAVTTTPIIDTTPAASTLSISNFVAGKAEVNIEEPEFLNNGPFINIIAPGDPLQGITKQIRRAITFIQAVEDAADIAAIKTAVDAFISGNNSDFPANIDGVVRPSSALGLIPVKGRKNLNGLAGRGLGRDKPLDYSWTNEIANDSIRQLIIRRADNLFDLIAFMKDAQTLAEIKLFAQRVNLDISEVENREFLRAQGPSGISYSNTISNNSVDMGLLLYMDRLVRGIEALSPITTTIASVNSAAVVVDTQLLNLKN